jgi:hypothetical protein
MSILKNPGPRPGVGRGVTGAGAETAGFKIAGNGERLPRPKTVGSIERRGVCSRRHHAGSTARRRWASGPA